MNCENKTLKRGELINFPFLYKVWLLAQSNQDFISFNEDKNGFVLNLNKIDLYLGGHKSIFNCKNRSTFINQLVSCGFEILKNTDSGHILVMQSPSAITSAADILSLVRRKDKMGNFYFNDYYDIEISANSRKRNTENISVFGKARLNFSIRFEFESHSNILKRKISECCITDDAKKNSVIELPVDLFENPNDSIAGFAENMEFAGYYGEVNPKQLKYFYDDFLPVYSNAENVEDPKIIKDGLRSVEPGPLYTYSATNDRTNCVFKETNDGLSNEYSNNNNLQPIFQEEDISMDDYIKFKHDDDEKNDKLLNTESIKKEIDDTFLNKNNLTHFCYQYRESMDLLYQNS